MKSSMREPLVESVQNVQKEEVTNHHNHIQENFNDVAPQIRLQSVPNEKIIEVKYEKKFF